MTDWCDVAFRDLLSEPLRNGVYKAKQFHGRGVKVVNMKELFAHDRISSQPDSRVELTSGELSKFILRDGDLLFARRSFVLEGSGKCSLVVSPPEETTFESSMIRARVDSATSDPVWLYYFFRSPQGRALMASIATRTAVSGITGTNLAALRIQVPDLAVQHRIAGILGTLDEFIKNNQRRVEVLEEMARAIYREWFDRFRFPGHENVELVDSEHGPIPDGWSRTALQRIAWVNATNRTPGAEEVIRYLDISALGERDILALASIPGAEAPGRARRVIRPGDIVWSMVRPSRRAHALLVSPGDDWIASTGLAVLTPSGVPSSYLFEAVSAAEFSDYLVSRESGAAYPAVKPKDFEGAAILLPDPPTLGEFDAAVGPMHRMAWVLREESASLASLRDRLLPKLVTGQIDVSSLDLDALAEDAVA